MSGLNILFVATDVAGVSFYRVKQPYDAMRKLFGRDEYGLMGYDPDLKIRMDYWESDLYGPRKSERVQDLMMACGWADVVVFMGLHSPASMQLFQGLRVRYPRTAFITENDDYLLSAARCNRDAVAAYCYGGDLARIGLDQIKMSDGVIVSTPVLKALYAPYNKQIYVVENAVNLSLWRSAAQSPSSQRVNFGWVGGGSHTDDLAHIQGAVFHILANHPNAEFTFVHGAPAFFKHKPGCEFFAQKDPRYEQRRTCPKCGGIDRIHWTHDFKTIDHYPKWVSGFKFTVGLAPLTDLNFTRGKSNLRWLEYSAMGIPTIASPLPHFTQSIRHGETGWLCADNTEEQWIEAMERMINEPALRENIGKNARAEVKANWTPAVMARKYRKAIGEIYHAKFNARGPGDADR